MINFVRTDQEGGFWDLFATRQWEPENIDLIVGLLEPGRAFVDIGAWVGPLSIIAAKCGARVVALEPDPVALRMFRLNLALNPDVAANITVVPSALGLRHGTSYLSSTKLGNSMSSIVHRGSETILVDTIDAKDWSGPRTFFTQM